MKVGVLCIKKEGVHFDTPPSFYTWAAGCYSISPFPLLKEPEKNVTLYYHAECSINQMINGYI